MPAFFPLPKLKAKAPLEWGLARGAKSTAEGPRAPKFLPLCRVCFPPERTPLGSMPVGVRPFSVSTLSLSSLQGKKGGSVGVKWN